MNKHQIMAAADREIKEVPVEEWGGSVHVKSLNVAEGIKFQAAREASTDEMVVALLLAYTLCDEDGKNLFAEEEVAQLCEKNPKVLKRLFYEALSLNKMGAESDQEREKK